MRFIDRNISTGQSVADSSSEHAVARLRSLRKSAKNGTLNDAEKVLLRRFEERVGDRLTPTEAAQARLDASIERRIGELQKQRNRTGDESVTLRRLRQVQKETTEARLAALAGVLDIEEDQ